MEDDIDGSDVITSSVELILFPVTKHAHYKTTKPTNNPKLLPVNGSPHSRMVLYLEDI